MENENHMRMRIELLDNLDIIKKEDNQYKYDFKDDVYHVFNHDFIDETINNLGYYNDDINQLNHDIFNLNSIDFNYRYIGSILTCQYGNMESKFLILGYNESHNSQVILLKDLTLYKDSIKINNDDSFEKYNPIKKVKSRDYYRLDKDLINNSDFKLIGLKSIANDSKFKQLLNSLYDKKVKGSDIVLKKYYPTVLYNSERNMIYLRLKYSEDFIESLFKYNINSLYIGKDIRFSENYQTFHIHKVNNKFRLLSPYFKNKPYQTLGNSKSHERLINSNICIPLIYLSFINFNIQNYLIESKKFQYSHYETLYFNSLDNHFNNYKELLYYNNFMKKNMSYLLNSKLYFNSDLFNMSHELLNEIKIRFKEDDDTNNEGDTVLININNGLSYFYKDVNNVNFYDSLNNRIISLDSYLFPMLYDINLGIEDKDINNKVLIDIYDIGYSKEDYINLNDILCENLLFKYAVSELNNGIDFIKFIR